MKRHYSDYAQHALRYYYKVERGDTPLPPEGSAEALNLRAVAASLAELGDSQGEVLQEVCASDKPMWEVVGSVARSNNLLEKQVWAMLAFVERRFSLHRGLIDR